MYLWYEFVLRSIVRPQHILSFPSIYF